MSIVKYTYEQHDVLDHITEVDGILLVAAGAGTGKTFLSEKITLALNPKKALYTAFNKAIVTEGIERFKGSNVECKTLHSLAYKYVRPNQKIEDLTYTCITENITYGKKALIIHAIDMFYVSASTDMFSFFEDYFKDEEKSEQLVDLSVKYVEKWWIKK